MRSYNILKLRLIVHFMVYSNPNQNIQSDLKNTRDREWEGVEI